MQSNDPNHPQGGVEHVYIEAPTVPLLDDDTSWFRDASDELQEATGIDVDLEEILATTLGYTEDFIAELATKGATQLSVINQCFLEVFMGNGAEAPSLSRLHDACVNLAIADSWPCHSTQADAAFALQEARKNDDLG